MARKTFYEILGVPNGAPTKDIRKAYLKLSLQLHPDKAGNSPEANNAFIAVKDAYETLSDDKKREKYDRDLKDGDKKKPPKAGPKDKYEPKPTRHPTARDPGHRPNRNPEDRYSYPPNRGHKHHQGEGYRGEPPRHDRHAPPPPPPPMPRSNAPRPSSWHDGGNEFRNRHPTCPRGEYPRHNDIFAAGGKQFCLCRACERRVLEDVYTSKTRLAEVISDIHFVNRHVNDLFRAVPGLFSPDMAQRLTVLERTAQAQLVFLDRWAGRTIAWVGCPSCTRRLVVHNVLADVERMCRQVEYWGRHAPNLARLTRRAIGGQPVLNPWLWTDEFKTALDKCRRTDI